MNSFKQILNDHGLTKDGFVTQYLRDDCDRYMDKYVPMQTGTLKNTKTYPSNHEIKYISPYAHYMYKGKKAIGASRPKGIKRAISNENLKYSGAKRGAEWDKRMLNDRKKDIIKDVENYIKNGGK